MMTNQVIKALDVSIASAHESEALVGADSQANTIVNLDNPLPLDPEGFPNLPRKQNRQLPCTLINMSYLLESYGITIRYNVINKKVYIPFPALVARLTMPIMLPSRTLSAYLILMRCLRVKS
jgi:hypothetical protein